MQHEDIAFAGLACLHELLANGSLTARELVSLHLDRIERLDPQLNAFVSTRSEAALREADHADQMRRSGDTRLLLGIPFAVKDEHDLAGEVTALGTGATAAVAEHDSGIVEILRGAGAIPVGKTTLPELGMHPFTESVTSGVTRNPWKPSRTPGGSSGGSAAAVAAGLVPFATASDGGGSIRIPASCCNLFGLKMQSRRITMEPHPESVGGLSVLGVLTRNVADAALLYDLLTDATAGRSTTPGWDRSLRDSVAGAPPRLRFGVTFDLGMRARVAPEVRALVEHTAEVLEELGHPVSEVGVDPGRWLLPFSILGSRILVAEARALEAPQRLERRTRTALRSGALTGDRAFHWATDRQRATAARTNRIFESVDLVLTPTLALPPVEVERWGHAGALRTARGVGRWCPFTSLWNFIDQPAANIPAGFTDSGLPVGAQFLAPPHAEPTLVAVAAQLESRLRWSEAIPQL